MIQVEDDLTRAFIDVKEPSILLLHIEITNLKTKKILGNAIYCFNTTLDLEIFRTRIFHTLEKLKQENRDGDLYIRVRTIIAPISTDDDWGKENHADYLMEHIRSLQDQVVRDEKE